MAVLELEAVRDSVSDFEPPFKGWTRVRTAEWWAAVAGKTGDLFNLLKEIPKDQMRISQKLKLLKKSYDLTEGAKKYLGRDYFGPQNPRAYVNTLVKNPLPLADMRFVRRTQTHGIIRAA